MSPVHWADSQDCSSEEELIHGHRPVRRLHSWWSTFKSFCSVLLHFQVMAASYSVVRWFYYRTHFWGFRWKGGRWWAAQKTSLGHLCRRGVRRWNLPLIKEKLSAMEKGCKINISGRKKKTNTLLIPLGEAGHNDIQKEAPCWDARQTVPKQQNTFFIAECLK